MFIDTITVWAYSVYIDRRVVGEMTEWFKEAVLKTVESIGSVGSNPTLSENVRRGARVVESGSLLRSCAREGTEGSNPSLSVYNVPIAQWIER